MAKPNKQPYQPSEGMKLMFRVVDLEEQLLNVRLYVQQSQTIICALAAILQVDPERFAEEISAANKDKTYENKLTKALVDLKEKRAAEQIKDVTEIV